MYYYVSTTVITGSVVLIGVSYSTGHTQDGSYTSSIITFFISMGSLICNMRMATKVEYFNSQNIQLLLSTQQYLMLFLVSLGVVFAILTECTLMFRIASPSSIADATDDLKVKSCMQLQAAIYLLHLSVVDKFVTVINTNFISLAITVQAISYVTHASQNISAAAKVDLFEIIFIRFLHLLAHHPDFSTAHENLQEMAKYIDFYLDLIVSLLYHLAMKAKTVRDGQLHTYSEVHIGVVGQAVTLKMVPLLESLHYERAHTRAIKACAQAHSWSLQSYPGKVKLPLDILHALPNLEAATKVMALYILKTVYLPEETSAWLLESSRTQKPAGTYKLSFQDYVQKQLDGLAISLNLRKSCPRMIQSKIIGRTRLSRAWNVRMGLVNKRAMRMKRMRRRETKIRKTINLASTQTFQNNVNALLTRSMLGFSDLDTTSKWHHLFYGANHLATTTYVQWPNRPPVTDMINPKPKSQLHADPPLLLQS
ncbi:hypothetical protein BDR07DRAFT_1383079 [Suillus spraguei]|nr:hypothetical protein BDR07DRAFT_1383079 [Suillus spraguei]